MYTEKLCDESSYIHTIYTDLTVIITFLVTKYNKVSFRYKLICLKPKICSVYLIQMT